MVIFVAESGWQGDPCQAAAVLHVEPAALMNDEAEPVFRCQRRCDDCGALERHRHEVALDGVGLTSKKLDQLSVKHTGLEAKKFR